MDSLPGMPWPLPWPFDRTYMQLALVAGVVVGAAAPCVGTFLVQKRLSLLGDGIGHAAVAGVGAGLLVGTGPTWTALGVALAAALAVEWLRARGSASADLALALIFYGGIAAGVVLASRSSGDEPPALPLRVDPYRRRRRRVRGARARRAHLRRHRGDGTGAARGRARRGLGPRLGRPRALPQRGARRLDRGHGRRRRCASSGSCSSPR